LTLQPEGILVRKIGIRESIVRRSWASAGVDYFINVIYGSAEVLDFLIGTDTLSDGNFYLFMPYLEGGVIISTATE
jgi:hypothetical protein